MSSRLTFQELLTAYQRWVINNPNLVTDVETIATWSSYFVAGKINKSPLVSEFIYTLSKLLSLFNDRLIREAYSSEVHYYGLRERIKLWLTMLHYSEVFIELYVKEKWGNKAKWTIATIIQLFKCSSALMLLHRFKELPVTHPPIPALQRKKLIEGREMEATLNEFFTLRRSGRVVRRVDGSLPIALRDWEPVKIKYDRPVPGINNQDLLLAESLHIIKPLAHLCAMRVFGTQAWRQWFVSFWLDIASMRLYNRHVKDLSSDQRLEISRRKLGLILYLLRSPMYNGYSKNVIESVLVTASDIFPLLSYICRPLIQYLNHWQDIYFYMWAS